MELGSVPRKGKPTIRVIRNRQGHYFVTAPLFKHVYVFSPGVERLKLSRKILVDADGMKRPAFNQRDPLYSIGQRQAGLDVEREGDIGGKMMSRPVIFPAGVFWALAVLATAAVAQVSDYELAENFKQSYGKLEQAMAAATDSARLDIVARQARDLKARYKTHEKLLDEALYPQTFASAFQRIDAGLASRRQETADREKMIAREQVLAGELEKKTRENEKLRPSSSG